MRTIRSLIFNIFFYANLAVQFNYMLAVLPLQRMWMQGAVNFWAWSTQVGAQYILGLRYEVRGREYVQQGRFIYACKHQSAWDTYIFLILFKDIAYVMKEELRSIPLWGWFAQKVQAIFVDRSAGASALKKLVRETKSSIESGRPVVVFPEGTRTQAGSKLPYFPGIAAMYRAANVPVVPVALNSGLYWGRNSFTKKPGTIIIEFLPPIEPGLDRKTFMAELETRIEAATDRLLAEAGYVAAEPAEASPGQAKPDEPEPIETEPVGTEPVGTEPVETVAAGPSETPKT